MRNPLFLLEHDAPRARPLIGHRILSPLID
jgi:hypothetical protein